MDSISHASEAPSTDLSASMQNMSTADSTGNSTAADAKAHDGLDDKPKVVRRLKKCFACKETILGRTKMAQDEIFHEIVRLIADSFGPGTN